MVLDTGLNFHTVPLEVKIIDNVNQMIHKKCQALIFLKNKMKKIFQTVLCYSADWHFMINELNANCLQK